MFHILIKTGNF